MRTSTALTYATATPHAPPPPPQNAQDFPAKKLHGTCSSAHKGRSCSLTSTPSPRHVDACVQVQSLIVNFEPQTTNHKPHTPNPKPQTPIPARINLDFSKKLQAQQEAEGGCAAAAAVAPSAAAAAGSPSTPVFADDDTPSAG